MKLFKLAVAAAAVLGLTAPLAMADLVIPTLNYRTGPYAPNGIPAADGFADYLTLLNERDGGIGGVNDTLKSPIDRGIEISAHIADSSCRGTTQYEHSAPGEVKK